MFLPLHTAQTRGADRPEQAPQALPEHAVGQTVDEAVAEAVADGQPCREEGGHQVAVEPGALQQEVQDVRHPQDVEDAGDAEQHHGVALVGAALATLPPLALLRAEAGVAPRDLARVLPADAEDAAVGEADGEGGGRVQQRRDERAEARLGPPRGGAPAEDVAVVAGLSPAEEGRQEDEGRVQPHEGDADPQAARRHQGGVGERPRDGDVAVHTDARQRRHGDALQHRDHVAEELAGELLVQASQVAQQGEGGHQAADAHHEVGVGHGLDEVAGGVVVEQGGAVKDEDHHQVARDDEDGEEENDDHLEDAGVQGAGVARRAQQAEGRAALVHPRGRGGVHV